CVGWHAEGTLSPRADDLVSRASEQQEPATVPVNWTAAGDYSDIRYELSGDGIAKITIDRPEVRNAFRPQTLIEISDALSRAREGLDGGVSSLTGGGPDAFCAGGDQRVRGGAGYRAEREAAAPGVGRFPASGLQLRM